MPDYDPTTSTDPSKMAAASYTDPTFNQLAQMLAETQAILKAEQQSVASLQGIADSLLTMNRMRQAERASASSAASAYPSTAYTGPLSGSTQVPESEILAELKRISTKLDNIGTNTGYLSELKDGGPGGLSPTASSGDGVDPNAGGVGAGTTNDVFAQLQGRANQGDNLLSYLRNIPGAQANAGNYLSYFSSFAANRAMQTPTFQQAQTDYAALAQEFPNPDSLTGPQLDEYTERLNGINAMATSSKWSGASDIFSTLATGYNTGRDITDAFGHLGGALYGGLARTSDQMYGFQTGYTGNSRDVFGIDFGAAAAGIGQKASELGFALNNQLTPDQAGTIYNNLFSNGWYGGQSTDAMRQGLASLMQVNPYMASMPQTTDMLDEATRNGATSVTSFIDALKQIPQAAKDAHTSIVQTMSDLQNLGSYNKTIGGTYAAGVQNGLAWQQTTGTPASVMQQLMSNPLVQGLNFSETGLMPMMQGLEDPSQQTSGIMSAINLLGGALGSYSPKSYRDPITGLTETISGKSQEEALMSNILGISPEQLNTLMNNSKGIEKGSILRQSGNYYDNAINKALKSGNGNLAYSDLTGAPWQKLQGAMMAATDSAGHNLTEDWGAVANIRRQLKSQHPGWSEADINKHANEIAIRGGMYNITNAGDVAAFKGADSGSEITRAAAALGFQPTPTDSRSGRYGALTRDSVSDDYSSSQQKAIGKYLLEHGDDISESGIKNVAKARQDALQKSIATTTGKYGPGNSGNSGPSLTIELGGAAKKMFHLTDPNSQQKANINAGSASINLNSYVNGPTADPYPNLDTAGSTGQNYSSTSPLGNGSY